MISNHDSSFADRRASLLSKLVLLFTRGMDPFSLADEAVKLVGHALGTTSVFVYLWDEEEKRLVLQTATPGRQEKGVGTVKLQLGEGITGWAALRQESVILPHQPSQDPRYFEVDSLVEDEFNSMLAVPIIDENERLLGVFALYSTEPNSFGENELSIAVEVGGLLAFGLVRAETSEALKRNAANARFLIDFPLSSTTSLVTALQYAAGRILELVGAEVCMLDYMSRRDNTATPITFSFREPESGSHRNWTTHSRTAAQTAIEERTEGLESTSVTLGIGASRGVLTLYRRSRFRTNDMSQVSALAGQLEVLLEAIDLSMVGASHAAALLFADSEQKTAQILSELAVEGSICPVTFRILDMHGDWETASRHLKEELAKVSGPRSLVLIDSISGIVLLDSPGGRVPSEFYGQISQAARRLHAEHRMRIAIGIGTTTSDHRRLFFAMRNAKAALNWAVSTTPSGTFPIAEYSDIEDVVRLPEVFRGLTDAVVDLVRSLEPLVRYDIEHGSQLVKTLSVFAAQGGAVAKTIEVLVIHRNTLRQRTQRIEQILGADFLADVDWLGLALAARVAESRVDAA
ncbi:helix-turn-helix domain-containing protein [Gulosibacter molinativorax]|uniref:GAF domain-containing protein n=1 Tax=Gulosibacter molinativorax TaxID=256821 RepID=A0ABT7C5J7_9MICO|nr:GAF domain-containing protein [Gulosibacter molinativorax]MDJ1370034.1 hypothetical protein [Gulosibacter molinativorax]QUY63775.1 Hypotetical protein [Gulosibacter molinativorax]